MGLTLESRAQCKYNFFAKVTSNINHETWIVNGYGNKQSSNEFWD